MPPKKKGGKKGKKKKGGDDDEGGPQPEGEPTEKEVLLKQEWVSITQSTNTNTLLLRRQVYPCVYSSGHYRRWLTQVQIVAEPLFVLCKISWVQPPILTISSNLAIVAKLDDPKCL